MIAAACVLLPLSSPAETLSQRAQLIAVERTTLGAEVDARLSQLDVLVGQKVAKGQNIAVFDCRHVQADRRISAARIDGLQAIRDADEKLVARGNAGKVTLLKSSSDLQVAEAEVDRIDVTLRKCRIRAPFDGVISEKHANAHQYLAPGDPVVDLINTTKLEVEMVVGSDWLAWLVPGTSFVLSVDETGEALPGQVVRIGAEVDPVSQTIRIMGRLSEQADHLLPGMSGDALFAAQVN